MPTLFLLPNYNPNYKVLVKGLSGWRGQGKRGRQTGRPQGPELTNALLKAWPPGLLGLHRDGVEVVYNLIILVSIAQIVLTCTE